MTRARSVSGSHVELLVVAAPWATSFLFIKLAVAHGLPPLILATIRAALGGAAIAVWLLASGKRIQWPPLRVALLLGLLNGVVPNVLLAFGLARIDSGPAAVLQATTPLIVAVSAHFTFADERLSIRQWLGIVVALFGVVLLVGPGAVGAGSRTLAGALAVLGAAASYAAAGIAVRRLRLAHPASAVLGQQIVAASIAVICALTVEPIAAWRQPESVWAALAGLAIISTAIPAVLFFRLTERITAARAALVHYLIPVCALAYGVVLLGERPGLVTFVGAAIVLASVFVAKQAERAVPSGAQEARP